mmetsp:Transcript_58099/g.147378  ORF Transcript_58099/g.147378 Transcript_58099/m.147378 type:complete len:315 (+) Transcript_58099:356-1300(+)
MIAVRLLAEREDTALLRVTKAWHAGHHQAHEHSPGTIGCRLPAKAPVCHVPCIAGKIRPGAPQGGPSCARGKGLEAGNGVADDRIDGRCVGAMEAPRGMHPWLEQHPLVLDRPLHRGIVWHRAVVEESSVLDALHLPNLNSFPSARRRQRVCRTLPRLSLEDLHHLLELLTTSGEIKELSVIAASAAPRCPPAAQRDGAVAKPLLSLQTCRGQPLPPSADNVEFWPLRAHGCVKEPRQAIVLQDRLHVVAVAYTGEMAARKLAAVRSVVQETATGAPRRQKLFQLCPGGGEGLIVGTLAKYHGRALRQLHTLGM